MDAVENDDLSYLHSFTHGIRRDFDAVVNGLTLPHSSGPIEGIVNKIIMWNLICQAGPCGSAVDIGWPVP